MNARQQKKFLKQVTDSMTPELIEQAVKATLEATHQEDCYDEVDMVTEFMHNLKYGIQRKVFKG